jgi:DNA-binding NtrC family response regulator
VDIRTIAATNQNLDRTVAEGKFREDLLYRLRVVEIAVPPLRERAEDIPALTEYFAERLARQLRLPPLGLDKECLDRFQKYAWPGNVRELQNALEHAAIISGDGRIKLKHLPPQIVVGSPAHLRSAALVPRPLAEMEMDLIRAALQASGGNRAKAAGILGISQTTLWRKLKNADYRHKE